jgi:hypothetical protein
MATKGELQQVTRYVLEDGILIPLNKVFTPPPGGGIGTPGPSQGSYTAKTEFAVGDLPVAMQQYHLDAMNTLDRTFDEVSTKGYTAGTLQELASSGDSYDIGRYLNHGMTTAAALLWHTGDPAILPYFEDIAGRAIASASGTDAYGERLHIIRRGETLSKDSTAIRLEDSLISGLMGILARVLFANNRDYTPALEFLKAQWQRWEAGAWDGGGSGKTHDNPELDDRHFGHTMVNRTRMAWHLWKITGNQNYKTGFDKLAGDRLMWGVGRVYDTVNAVNLAYDSWPFGMTLEGTGLDAMNLTYTRYFVVGMYELAREGALTSWSFNENAFWDGVNHFFLRDADTLGVRDDTSGSTTTDIEPEGNITVSPYNGQPNRSFGEDARNDFHAIRDRAWYLWPAAHRSALLKNELLDQRVDEAPEYTRNLSGPVGLLVETTR